jgi:Tfp pilus assembly protein PilN
VGDGVTRFNYLQRGRPQLRFATVAIDNRIRGPLVALFATLLLTAILSSAQLVRLQAAQHAYAAASTRLLNAEAAVARTRALHGRILAASRLAARVDGIRRASLVHANELTWIGNHLPAHVWLVALRYEGGTYSLEGTSDRASAVGAAMDALNDGSHPIVPQLVSLHDDGSTGATRVRYRLFLHKR